jgi:hypothetical protein
MVMSPPPQPAPSHPSPPSTSLAQQIDREILELRNFFEDHREEMMSMLYDPQAQVRIQDLYDVHRTGEDMNHSLQCFCSEVFITVYCVGRGLQSDVFYLG